MTRRSGRSAARGGRRGFTLLEVMVALAVVALALGAGLRAAGVLIDNAQRLGDVMAAQWCADNQLTELRLRRSFPGVGDSDFACEQLHLGRVTLVRLVRREHVVERRDDAQVRPAHRPDIDLVLAGRSESVRKIAARQARAADTVLGLSGHQGEIAASTGLRPINNTISDGGDTRV